MSTSPNLLAVYKQILRSASRYPSRNREKIYKSIQEEFRENANITDSDKVKKCRELAYQGLSQLRQFDPEAMSKGSEKDGPNWDVHLESNPMPKPPERE
mmetsp:Transcript_14682/g.22743  ORF Transcript_14682/g.22743 Transcript_14682/m.22743 type:complete len:99 (+) Transcript_14682:23-319(+)